MDMLKTLITTIPTSGLPIKVLFFVIGTTILAWYSFGYVPTEHKQFVQSKEKLQAISWYLGWNTMVLLIPNWPRASQVLPSMDAYLETLEISVDEPSAYYLDKASSDGGARAQNYREQVFAKIKAKHGRDIGNYYGVSTNLLQDVPHYSSGSVPSAVQKKLQELVNLLDLPSNLEEVPSQDLLKWLNSVNSHFENRL